MKTMNATNQKIAKLLTAMLASDAGAIRGALLGIRDIRKACELRYAEFDQTCKIASQAEMISLHAHDYPASLTNAEREEMLNWNGRYYVGIAIRQSR